MTAVDLDAIDAQVGYVREDQDQTTLAWALAANTLPNVVAELRAAREVVEAVRNPGCVCAPPPPSVQRAMAAYDQTTGAQS